MTLVAVMLEIYVPGPNHPKAVARPVITTPPVMVIAIPMSTMFELPNTVPAVNFGTVLIVPEPPIVPALVIQETDVPRETRT